VIVGYVNIQIPETPAATTYVVVPSDPKSNARRQLGVNCDVFTAVPVANDQKNDTVTLYVTGGKNCMLYKRDVLKNNQIKMVPGPTPSSTHK
jgi:hypothetical protein